MLETSIFIFSCSGVGSIEVQVLPPFDYSWEVGGSFLRADSFGLAKAVCRRLLLFWGFTKLRRCLSSKLECTSKKLVKFSTEVGCHTLTLKLNRPKLRNTLFLQKSQTIVSYTFVNPIFRKNHCCPLDTWNHNLVPS